MRAIAGLRRALRILPLYYLIVGIAFVVAPLAVRAGVNPYFGSTQFALDWPVPVHDYWPTLALFMAKVAKPRTRNLMVVAVLLPLWSSYLVKVYAWRVILSAGGVFDWALRPLGLSGPGYGNVAVWLVMSYLWLPYMILPIFAGLERIPNSLLAASEDLGAGPLTTFRRVVLPMALPAVVAGSIFTFSLTLGDYITPQLVSNNEFIGNVVYSNITNNLPLASAFATVPILIMVIYLLIARRLGAFEHL